MGNRLFSVAGHYIRKVFTVRAEDSAVPGGNLRPGSVMPFPVQIDIPVRNISEILAVRIENDIIDPGVAAGFFTIDYDVPGSFPGWAGAERPGFIRRTAALRAEDTEGDDDLVITFPDGFSVNDNLSLPACFREIRHLSEVRL
jgi:hypothetical protein